MEPLGFIKADQSIADTDSFEIIYDDFDKTISFFKLNSDEGLTIRQDQAPELIKILTSAYLG